MVRSRPLLGIVLLAFLGCVTGPGDFQVGTLTLTPLAEAPDPLPPPAATGAVAAAKVVGIFDRSTCGYSYTAKFSRQGVALGVVIGITTGPTATTCATGPFVQYEVLFQALSPGTYTIHITIQDHTRNLNPEFQLEGVLVQ